MASTWSQTAFENKSKYYISLYLENQLTGGEWHPKKYYGNTVTSEEMAVVGFNLTCTGFPSKTTWARTFPKS